MSFSRVQSGQPVGIRGAIVIVESDIERGVHSFSIVGLPDKAVDESKNRVTSALRNSNLLPDKYGSKKITISLAPAEMKKEGAYHDVAIALAILSSEEIIKELPNDSVFIGELGLDGSTRAVKGILPIALACSRNKIKNIFVPKENVREASLVQNIHVFGFSSLKELVEILENENREPEKIDLQIENEKIYDSVCFEDIKGQENAKRALMIAAAGGHNIILSGPPGTGKTLLAKAFASILPPLSTSAMLEVVSIHSVSSGLDINKLSRTPPFRSPHHTASYVALIGGGTNPKPGEVTLAHCGVLFLDEFPEFEKRVIEALRQPIEDGVVNVSRAKGTVQFPSRFTLIGAMNPCPCGYRNSGVKDCVCSAHDILRYERKLSGPLLDRIDIMISVPHISYTDLMNISKTGEKSESLRSKIISARKKQIERYRVGNVSKRVPTNSTLTNRELSHFIKLDTDVQNILNQSAEKLKLSPRAYHRVIKLARTIADLENSDDIKSTHIMEALQYRPKVNE